MAQASTASWKCGTEEPDKSLTLTVESAVFFCPLSPSDRLPSDNLAQKSQRLPNVMIHSALRNSSYGRNRLSNGIELPVAC